MSAKYKCSSSNRVPLALIEMLGTPSVPVVATQTVWPRVSSSRSWAGIFAIVEPPLGKGGRRGEPRNAPLVPLRRGAVTWATLRTVGGDLPRDARPAPDSQCCCPPCVGALSRRQRPTENHHGHPRQPGLLAVGGW